MSDISFLEQRSRDLAACIDRDQQDLQAVTLRLVASKGREVYPDVESIDFWLRLDEEFGWQTDDLSINGGTPVPNEYDPDGVRCEFFTDLIREHFYSFMYERLARAGFTEDYAWVDFGVESRRFVLELSREA